MDALTFAEWQREQDDERWAAYAPVAEDGPHNGGCGCAVSQVFGGDCAHTIDLEYELGGDPELHPEAILTGGTTPAHYPGAYPNLSCCGGPVQLVPR